MTMVAVMMVMVTTFAAVTSLFKVFMFKSWLKLDDSHLNDFLSHTFSWLWKMTKMFTMFKHSISPPFL
ncbi:hypothetical protein FKV70_02365 [Paenibacillus ottowii]|uniref:Uncharacterized protein n=1 Tax=Paenibacillus ottowii TaxID=2315729 RepID=A0ABY3BBH7_9BACL|nr:hypothetical protein A9P44_01410 [Paenibacillus polymyxa]TQS01518.1 hypothetical protein FKV70_02365 [Paenibacillus ottowii]